MIWRIWTPGTEVKLPSLDFMHKTFGISKLREIHGRPSLAARARELRKEQIRQPRSVHVRHVSGLGDLRMRCPVGMCLHSGCGSRP